VMTRVNVWKMRLGRAVCEGEETSADGAGY